MNNKNQITLPIMDSKNRITLRVYISDGKDAHAEGMFVWVLNYYTEDGSDGMACGGGYQSRQSAFDAAEAFIGRRFRHRDVYVLVYGGGAFYTQWRSKQV